MRLAVTGREGQIVRSLIERASGTAVQVLPVGRPELDLAAGACEGNGLLIDISDPANPVGIEEVSDPNFSYWHGATFTNDGKTLVKTFVAPRRVLRVLTDFILFTRKDEELSKVVVSFRQGCMNPFG